MYGFLVIRHAWGTFKGARGPTQASVLCTRSKEPTPCVFDIVMGAHMMAQYTIPKKTSQSE